MLEQLSLPGVEASLPEYMEEETKPDTSLETFWDVKEILEGL